MILTEQVDEFIYNMKFKKSVVGGIKESSVYQNMRKLSDMYESQISDLKAQLHDLQEKSNNTEQVFNELKEKHEEELDNLKSKSLDILTQHQDKIDQFLKTCEEFSNDVGFALEEYQLK